MRIGTGHALVASDSSRGKGVRKMTTEANEADARGTGGARIYRIPCRVPASCYDGCIAVPSGRNIHDWRGGGGGFLTLLEFQSRFGDTVLRM